MAETAIAAAFARADGRKAERKLADWRAHLALMTVEEPQIDRLIVIPTGEGVEVYIEPEKGVELCVCLDWRQTRLLARVLEQLIEGGKDG